MAGSEWTLAAADAGVRLDKFLAAPERLGSRARAMTAIEKGKVFLNGSEATPADAAARPRPQQVGEVTIVYEDEALLVVNKPPGLLAVPLERKANAPSVFDRLEDHFRSRG